MQDSSYKFGEFDLDCARYELRRGDRVLKLERIPMDLLILLAQRNGDVVTRQEIVDRLWGKDVFVDTEHGINTAIRKIRQVLKDDPERPRFVQTVTGKGYRFVAAPRNGKDAASLPRIESETAEAVEARNGGVPRTAKRRLHWLAWTAVAVLGAVIAAAGFNVGGVRDHILASRRPAQIHSLAVLPLTNLSGDASQDYFAAGMTDELITMLAKNTTLRVVSRTSALQYQGAKRPVREIARELDVDDILEGSIERSGHRIHMTVQLIDGNSDSHLWADSYDRDFNDALSLPSEIAEAIARETKMKAGPAAIQRPINAEAHDAYLRGWYFWIASDDRSQEYFTRAVRLQPDYAAAWSGLADFYTVRAAALRAPSAEVMPKAKEAALKAVALDDSLPQAHNALAAAYLFGDWDLKRADEESLRAVSLTPPYAEAHHLRCYILAINGKLAESVEEQRRGTEMDPFARPWALGLALTRARRFDDAIQELRFRSDVQPQNSDLHFLLMAADFDKGLKDDAAAEMEKGLLSLGDKKSADAMHREFARGGGDAVAVWDLNNWKAKARKSYISPWLLALLSGRLKRKDETLKFLEQAYAEHSARIIFLQVEPEFDFLHSEERYRALVRKMGLTPSY